MPPSLPSDVGRRMRRIAATTALSVSVLTLTFSAAPAAAATRTPYNTNLVKNPSFEAGSANSGYAWIAVPSWSTYGNMTVVKYGAPNGFPSLAQGAAISGDKKFFTMGTPPEGGSLCQAVALQSIPIKRRAGAIDAGRVLVDFRAYLGTYGTQSDTAVAILSSYGSTGTLIEQTFYASISQTNGQMIGLGGSAPLKAGTRTLRIVLMSKNTQGYCDAYFDRISVKLSLI